MSIFHIPCSLRVKNPSFPGNLHCFASTGCCRLPSPWHLRYSTASMAGTERHSLVLLLLPQPWPSAACSAQHIRTRALQPDLAFLVEAQLIFTGLSHSFRLSNHTAPAWIKLHAKRQQLQSNSLILLAVCPNELILKSWREGIWESDRQTQGEVSASRGIAKMCLSRWQQWEEKPIRRVLFNFYLKLLIVAEAQALSQLSWRLDWLLQTACLLGRS